MTSYVCFEFSFFTHCSVLFCGGKTSLALSFSLCTVFEAEGYWGCSSNASWQHYCTAHYCIALWFNPVAVSDQTQPNSVGTLRGEKEEHI